MTAPAMTSTDVLDCLAKRWPDDQYLSIREAPSDAARQGRKIDLLVVSLWASRGYDLDAVEVKVSLSDWKREVENPAKAHFWWGHSDRFWIAAPLPLAMKIRDSLPGGWGLLGCSEGASKAIVQAQRNPERRPFTWPQTVGVMRATADCGFGALQRAEQRGYSRGKADAEQREVRESSEQRLRDRVAQLEASHAEFTAASGIDLTHAVRWPQSMARIGRHVNAAIANLDDPTAAAQRLTNQAGTLHRLADGITSVAADLEATPTPPVSAG